MTQSDTNSIVCDQHANITNKEQLLSAIANLNELVSVEQVIRSKLQSDVELLVEIPEYLLKLGGKRMRPVLALLTAHALSNKSPIPQAVIDVAAGIELIHMATLLHDDIIDNSPLRRHKESPYIKFGLSNSLLAGDFLLVRAFALCATLDPAIILATENACVHLTEGEILEIPLFRQRQTINDALLIAEKKTAALFKLAAFSAAFLTQSNPTVVDCFSEFGRQLGIAFQILDDILDVTSDADLLGKPSGTDIRERKPSLINILWLESDSKLAQQLLLAPTSNETTFIEQALIELRSNDCKVVQIATEHAKQHALNARQALIKAIQLSDAESNSYQTALHALIDYTIERIA